MVIHFRDHLHPQQRGLLSLVGRVHQSCGQPCNNDCRNSLGQQSFPTTAEICDEEAMHELGHKKGHEPDHHGNQNYPRGDCPSHDSAGLRSVQTSHLKLRFRHSPCCSRSQHMTALRNPEVFLNFSLWGLQCKLHAVECERCLAQKAVTESSHSTFW